MREVDEAVRTLRQGGIILYPTDTVWGLGCDATNAGAVERIYRLKRSEKQKVDARAVRLGRHGCPLRQPRPRHRLRGHGDGHLPPDGHPPRSRRRRPEPHPRRRDPRRADPRPRILPRMLRAFGKPVVSTSANISGEPTAVGLQDVAREIVDGADFVRKPPFRGGIPPAKPPRSSHSERAARVKIIRE